MVTLIGKCVRNERMGNDQPTDTLKVKVKKHLAGCVTLLKFHCSSLKWY